MPRLNAGGKKTMAEGWGKKIRKRKRLAVYSGFSEKEEERKI